MAPEHPPHHPTLTPRELERLSLAYHRSNNVLSRSTSVAAAEFFSRDSTNEENYDEDEEWKTLPQRLACLVACLHSLNDDDDDDDDMIMNTTNHNHKNKSRIMESNRVALTASIVAIAPPTFHHQFQQLFTAALTARQKQWEHQTQQEEDDSSSSSMEDDSEEDVVEPPFDETSVYSALSTLGFLPSPQTNSKLLNQPLSFAMHHVISEFVRNKIIGEYDEYGMLDTIHTWKNTVLHPWLMDVVNHPNNYYHGDRVNNEKEKEEEEIGGWTQRLNFAVFESFVNIRMTEMFDIVAEYPDSQPAVEELRDALNYTTQFHKTKLSFWLRDALRKRLLHPGANTSQILDVYISTIKVLRVIDPSDGLLEAVADPVRSYLRGRGDTVRCIITGLTDEDSGGDLYEELRRQDAPKPLEHTLDSDDEEDTPSPNWQPILSPHQQSNNHTLTNKQSTTSTPSNQNQAGDILSMLVGIYGSQELFVNEYRIMLADKLLASLDFDTDKEVHTLELLKLRFGESSMRQCEIMIKDLDDSKRIVSNIHGTIRTKDRNRRKKKRQPETKEDDDSQPVVDAAIVSHIFWPPLLKENLKVHPKMQQQINQFGTEYANLKNPRRLIWLSQLGTVELELEVQDDDDGDDVTTKTFTCPPLHATLIMFFEDKDEWTAADLSNETGVNELTIVKKMGYWINQRVLKSTLNQDGVTIYTLATSDDDEKDNTIEECEEEDQQAAMEFANAQQAEEDMKVYESYIFGMLKNLGQLPLERIHNMMKMFVIGSDLKYDKTPVELGGFLKKLCKDDKLECGADGLYKLVKK